jgi:hypothetical protein
MPVELKELDGGKVLELHLTGRLAREDYQKFVPEVERLVEQHGKIRMLVDMHDFHGWTTAALWEDTKFAVQYFSDIERLAVVGETKWQEGASLFAKPFTAAVLRYFDRTKADEARAWLRSDKPDPASEEST